MSPIRPEMRALYPPDWPAISRAIRVRDGNRCKRCRLRNYAVGYRDETGFFVPAGGNGPQDAAGRGEVWPSGDPIAFTEACEVAAVNNTCGRTDDDGHHWFVVVLTVAHLNHDPSDCRDENLEALCQRCHLHYDQEAKRAGIAARRRLTNLDLLDNLSA